jgi:hypothetical protein
MSTVENKNSAQAMNVAQFFLLFQSVLDFGSLQCISQ